MSNVIDLKSQKDIALAAADAIVSAAERQGRQLTSTEQTLFDTRMREVNSLTSEISRFESRSSTNPRAAIEAARSAAPKTTASVFPSKSRGPNKEPIAPKYLSAEYAEQFLQHCKSLGQFQLASYEGGSTTGAPIVPLIVEPSPIAFAPPDQALRRLVTVTSTASDIKLPQTTNIPTAAIRSESGGSNNAFTVSDPSRSQTKLSAFMTSVQTDFSIELFDDWTLAQATTLRDSGMALTTLEEQKFLSGSGSGEPEGLLGNIGTGVTGVAAGSDSYATELLNATFDAMGSLNAKFLPNASWLMSHATSVVLRKAQSTAGLNFPVWTRVGDQEYLHGFPVFYSSGMPAIGAGNTPVVFGDFKSGYIVGDRGGSAVRLKILDQDSSKAILGLVPCLIFRRTDGRVWQPQALQPITLT